MGQRKGQTGNPNGRGKGKKNKRTVESLKRVEYVLGLLEETIEQDIMAVKPAERVALWNDLQEYIRPKLSRQDINHQGEVALTTPAIVFPPDHTKP